MRDQFWFHLQKILPHCANSKFLLTVSGGKDSVALTHLFAECGLDFEMAHCNFHLRGEASNTDMLFVQQLARKLDKRLYIKEFDTKSLQKKSGKSIEMVARELRYAWFRELAPQYDYVVTAHHADDNAETVLLNLTRGTGLRGLVGIPEQNDVFLRPLLPFTSAEILHYLQENQWDFRTDESNFDEIYHRNKIRHSVIPKLKEINPDIIHTFYNNSFIFNKIQNFIERELCQIKAEICHFEQDILKIDIRQLLQNPDQELVLYEILRPFHFDGDVIENICRSLQAESGRTFYSATHQLLKDREQLLVMPQESGTVETHICDTEADLTKLGFTITFNAVNEKLTFEDLSRNTLIVDAAKFAFPIELRGWRKGDRFVPFGMKGSKKLSDFFIDQKINRWEKQRIPLLCSGGKIVWIVGLRADNRFRIDTNSTQYYKIEYNGRI